MPLEPLHRERRQKNIILLLLLLGLVALLFGMSMVKFGDTLPDSSYAKAVPAPVESSPPPMGVTDE